MRHFSKLILFAGGVAIAGVTPELLHAEDGAIERGRQVFSEACAACHGSLAKGGVGPNLTALADQMDLDGLTGFIKAPSPLMPAFYPAALTDQDVSDVADYLLRR